MSHETAKKEKTDDYLPSLSARPCVVTSGNNHESESTGGTKWCQINHLGLCGEFAVARLNAEVSENSPNKTGEKPESRED